MSVSQPPPVIHQPSFSTTDHLEVDDVGFTTLHEGGLDPQLDVVFIHGIQGHPSETWSHRMTVPLPAKIKSKFPGIGRSRLETPTGGTESPNNAPSPDPLSGLWPAKVLSLDFPNARILTYGYDSRVSNFFGGAASQNNIVTIAGGFLNDLAAERLDARKRPLIIVSHSMGGLITKEALRRASTEPEKNADLRDVLESTAAVIFFGTPHRGGAYTNLGLTMTKIAKAAGFDVFDRNIRDLNGNSPVLTMIRQGFSQLLDSDKFEVSTFQESLGYKGTGLLNGKIVPNESSELGHSRNERINSINANHMNMCKFKDKNDDGYRKFKAEMVRHMTRLQNSSQQSSPGCIDSFLVPQMSDRLIQISEAHAETLGWIYDETGPGIAPWLRSGTGVFWIQGKPGSGKSTAMKFMLQNERTHALLNTEVTGVNFKVIGCFFTDRADRIQASWGGVLRSLIYQLLSQNSTAANIVLPIWKEANTRKLKGNPLWSVDALEQILRILKTESHQSQKVCFLIDAIDEHDGNHTRMCNFLHELCDIPSDNAVFKVLAASRPENVLQDLFVGDLTMKIHNWTRGDIQRFIFQKLSSHPRWDTLLIRGGTEIAARIRKDIESRAKGVFLWVRLIIDEMLEGLTDGYSLLELEQQANQFPDDLNNFLALIVNKIEKKHYEELLIIIETLLCVRGALGAAFLKLVIRANLQTLNKKAVLPSFVDEEELDVKGFSRRLQSRCRGLVEIYVASNSFVVQFLHQTVKEYFLKNENLSRISQNLRNESRIEGKASISGHFFLLNGYLEGFRLQEIKVPPSNGKVWPGDDRPTRMSDYTSDIIYHTSALERKFETYPVQVLQELDYIITQATVSGDLWPSQACGMLPIPNESFHGVNKPMELYMERERLPSRHSLLMLAIALGWTQYIQQMTSTKAITSIRVVGVRQFAYLCCSKIFQEAMPLLESANFLVKSGVNVTKRQEIADGDQADALGFFISSHLDCLIHGDVDHILLIHYLLERGANPQGKCLGMGRPDLATCVTITEALISRYGLTRSLSLIELLGAYCPKSESLAAELFDTSSGKVFESESLAEQLNKDTLLWLLDNGAYISESSALLIYRPLIEGFQHQYKGERTYSEVLESLSETGMHDPASSLNKSLMNLYEYEMGRDICQRERFLLDPGQRQRQFYNAAARGLVAEFNPLWTVDETGAEDPSTNLPDFLRLE